MEITENNVLEMHNVLSYRGKMTQAQVNTKMQEIQVLIENSGVEKAGSITTTTFSVEPVENVPMFDVEILVPLSATVPLSDGYAWKPYFYLGNAVKLHYEGKPDLLQDGYSKLQSYFTQNQLTPITSAYNMTIKAMSTPNDFIEVDVYIGVKGNHVLPNVL